MNKKSIIIVVLSMVFGLLFQGCETLGPQGRSSTYWVTSTPAGAEVLVDGESKGTTPTQLSLRNPVRAEMVVRMDGFTEKKVRLSSNPTRDVKQVDIKLESSKAGYTVIQVVETASGSEIRMTTVPAREEVIERSPNVSAVVKVTDLPSNRWISTFSLSPKKGLIALEIFERETTDDQQVHHYSNLWVLKANSGSAMRRLTDGRFFDRDPSFSVDGSQLYFSSNRSGRNQIWRISAEETGGQALITRGTNQQRQPAISPQGDSLLYIELIKGSSIPQIWKMPLVRDFPMQLREGTGPTWSPDGEEILFTSQDRNTGKFKVWLMSKDGGHPTQLTMSADCNDIHPCWSPDGKQILFASDRATVDGEHNYDIWIMNKDGQNMRQLTTNGSTDDHPTFSSDGRTIYFRSNRGLKWDIWAMQLVNAVEVQ